MMIVPLVFWLFLLGALTIGWQAGDRHDREFMVTILGASICTAVAQISLPYLPSRILTTGIDMGLLLLAIRFAMISERHWPVWFAGFHGAATCLSLFAYFLPRSQHEAVAMAAAFWAIPSLTVMVLGILKDHTYCRTSSDSQRASQILQS